MAAHDGEEFLKEDTDLDYEVDDEVPEDELLADDGEFDLNDDLHTSVGAGEPEEDVLELGVTDTGLEDLDTENLNAEDDEDSTIKEEKLGRDRFTNERPTTKHTPIVFDCDETQIGNRNDERPEKPYVKGRNLYTRGRGRGGGKFNAWPNKRGNFNSNYSNRGGFVPNNNNNFRPNHMNVQTNFNNFNPPQESKKVLINPHFRGNIQPNQDARLVWDNNQPRNFPPNINQGNFIPNNVAQQQFPQQSQMNMPTNVWNNFNNFPQPVVDNFNSVNSFQTLPIQNPDPQNINAFNNMNTFNPTVQFNNNQYANIPQINQPMQSFDGQRPMQQLLPPGNLEYTQNVQSDWYRNNNELINNKSFETHSEQFNIPTQSGFCGRMQQGNDIRVLNVNNSRNVTFPQMPDNFNQNNFNNRPNIPQNQMPPPLFPPNQNMMVTSPNNIPVQMQQPMHPMNVQRGFNQGMHTSTPVPLMQYQNSPPNFTPPHISSAVPQTFPNIPIKQEINKIRPSIAMNQNKQPVQRSPVMNRQFVNRNVQASFPNANKVLKAKALQFTRKQYLHRRLGNKVTNTDLLKRKKATEFRNLHPVQTVDVPDTTIVESEIKEEDEDEETRAYRLKIEEQKKLRERILREKEERRKRAAAAQNTAGTSEQTISSILEVKPKIVRIQPVQPKRVTPQPKLPNPAKPRTLVQLKNAVITSTPQYAKKLQLQKQARLLAAQKQIVNPNIVNVRVTRQVGTPNAIVQVETKDKIDVMPNTVSSTSQNSNRVVFMNQRVVHAKPSVLEPKVEPADIDEVPTKEHLSDFLKTHTVIANGAINPVTTQPPLLKTPVVRISNLAASTTAAKLRQLCKGVGIVQSIQMTPNSGQAIIRFKNVQYAHNFFKKYQRKMVDLSLIDVTLVPITSKS